MAPHDFKSLLRHHAIDGLQINDQQMSDIVDQIAEKMYKLPLAAKVVGNNLRQQPEFSFWRDTLEKVDMSDIMKILMWSFHRFDVQLQRCFLFCSVFPKGVIFGLPALPPYWVALDFLIQSSDNENVEDKGLKCFKKMVANSIFQLVNKKYYIMHDLYHDLAEMLSTKDCLRITNADRKEKICSDVQHVYLDVNNLQECLSSIRHLSNLRTLILGNPFIDDISDIISMISKNFRYLRVLHVYCKGYKTLPTDVGHLRNLRLLYIWESSIEELQNSVSELYHLQFVYLPSSIKTLPTKLSNLIKLKHIDMFNSDGSLVVNTFPPIPYLGKLTSLQNLNEFHVRNENGYHLQQLGHLKEIGGSLRIVNLENVRNKNEADEAKLIDKHRLFILELVWAHSTENELEIIETLRPPAYLKFLTIDGYGGSTYPTWLQEESFIKNIQYVRFCNCNALTNLPQNFNQFRNCSKLFLQNLGALRELSTIPENLDLLLITNCGALRELSTSLANFARLLIRNCGALIELSTFPENLVMLKIINCGALTKLFTFPENLDELTIIQCPCLIFVCQNELQANENQRIIMETRFLRIDVKHFKEILNDELKSFELTGSKENYAEQLQIIESATRGNAQELLVNENVNRAWWSCHQQRMNFIFSCNTQANILKLPSMLHILYLGFCCVSDKVLSNFLGGITTLEKLYLEGIMTITKLPPSHVMESLKSLCVLEIKHCWCLTSLGGLHALPYLQHLLVEHCWCIEMESDDTSRWLPLTLQSFIIKTSAVPQAIFNGHLINLQNVEISDCYVPSSMSFHQLTLLKSLTLAKCPDLQFIRGLDSRPFISTLNLLDLPNLDVESVLNSWQGCQEQLFISNSVMLKRLLSSQRFAPPQKLGIQSPQEEAISFENFDHIQSIKILMFINCENVTSIKALSCFSTLEFLDFIDCPKITKLPELPRSIQCITIRGCPELQKRCQPKKGQGWKKIQDIYTG